MYKTVLVLFFFFILEDREETNEVNRANKHQNVHSQKIEHRLCTDGEQNIMLLIYWYFISKRYKGTRKREKDYHC
jgi:hypothetical protein